MKKLIYEKGCQGRVGYTLPQTAIDEYSIDSVSERLLRSDDLLLPCLNEFDIANHYRSLLEASNGKKQSECVFSGKYLYSVFDDVSRLDGFTGIHPYQLGDASQGALELEFTLIHMLCDIFGMDSFTVQPTQNKGGLFTALCMLKAYHKKNKKEKDTLLINNDADESVLRCIERLGYKPKTVVMNKESVALQIDDSLAGAIICNPDNCGNFISDMSEISEMIHAHDGIVCCDANNMHSLLGVVRPGDIGADIVYFDAQRLFAISDYKGECDCGAVGVKDKLCGFMPVPVIEIDDLEQYYYTYDRPDSIGKVNDYYGDFIGLIKVLAYVLSMGYDGFKEISYACALNANYMKAKLVGNDGICAGKFTFNNTNIEPCEAVDKKIIDEVIAEIKE